MDSQRKKHLVSQIKDLKWNIEIQNKISQQGVKTAKLKTLFNSENNLIEEVLHKIELDLYTYMIRGIEEPIEIKIQAVKK